jgi:type II pantothenate kinase
MVSDKYNHDRSSVNLNVDMLEISKNGDNRNVDLLVGDIYGSDYSKLGLKSSRIASSFGKVFKKGARQNKDNFASGDIAKSLLYMVSNNIGQIAYLNAQQHGIKRIYFGGCFIRGKLLLKCTEITVF